MPISPSEIKNIADLLEQAAERGAKRALESIGLHDEQAGKDINDLRTLIDGWRVTKKAIGAAIIQWSTVGLLAAISGLLWFKLGGSK